MEYPERIVRQRELRSYIGLGHSQVDVLMGRGEFPLPIKLGSRSKAWLASELAAWQAWRKAQRDKTAPKGSSWRDFLTISATAIET